jgi:alcohol dehydrogenase (cytochrome c)
VLFTGDAQGNFILLDATSGKLLWHFQTGGEIHSGPMAFAVDGEEYVGITAGSALYTFGLASLSRDSASQLHDFEGHAPVHAGFGEIRRIRQ